MFVCIFLFDWGIVFGADGKIKCDCAFSIGPACRPAQWLRKTKKRFQSSPLDWMMRYSLDTALHFFENKFSDFFEDVEDTGEYSDDQRMVRDKKNGIVSMHHFNKKLSLGDAKSEVRNMMLRRAKEVDNILQNSDSIVLLCNRQKDSLSELKKFIQGFSKLYPEKNITLMNVRSGGGNDPTRETVYSGKAATKKKPKKKAQRNNSKSKRKAAVQKKVTKKAAKKPAKKRANQSKKLRIIEYCFNDVSPDTNKYPEWEGNPFGWKKVIEDIELTNKFYNKNMNFKKVEF